MTDRQTSPKVCMSLAHAEKWNTLRLLSQQNHIKLNHNTRAQLKIAGMTIPSYGYVRFAMIHHTMRVTYVRHCLPGNHNASLA